MASGYGIASSINVLDTGMLTFSFDDGAYTVMVDQKLRFGDVGPIPGLVLKGQLEGSTLCHANDDEPIIGRVIASDARELRIRIDTDICRCGPGESGPCTRVDHLTAEAVLPFGWRHLTGSRPVDLVTPGLENYLAKYFAQVGGAGVPGFPQPSSTDGNPSSGTNGDPTSNTGPSPGTGTSNQRCDCSCEALEKMKEQDKDNIDPTTAQCVPQCVNEWMKCAAR